jgi:hypothetical protein
MNEYRIIWTLHFCFCACPRYLQTWEFHWRWRYNCLIAKAIGPSCSPTLITVLLSTSFSRKSRLPLPQNKFSSAVSLRRVWRYQRGNQNPYIEEEQTTQWPKEKVQRDKQRSTKHTHCYQSGSLHDKYNCFNTVTPFWIIVVISQFRYVITWLMSHHYKSLMSSIN